MSKIEAKAPQENGWQAIDIYLFANGQQNSPPRKYHLSAGQLSRWDSTLHHLAKTHYGSQHKVIEIYTVCGGKINGPLDLRDGTPYVAVVPPDPFIDSGYAKYLIKASRSWEKQQTKRKNSEITEEKTQETFATYDKDGKELVPVPGNDANQTTAIPEISAGQEQSGVPFINECVIGNVSELKTIKTPDDSFAVESMLVKPRKPSKVEKPDQQPPRRSIITTTPRTEKRRSSVQQHTSFMKTRNSRELSNNNSTCKTKETFHRKTLTKIPLKINVPGNELALKMKRIMKISSKSAPIEMATTPQTISPIPSELIPPPTMSDDKEIHSNNKTLVTDNGSVPDVIFDKEIIVMATENNIYQNPLNELKSMTLETYRVPMVDEMTSCNIIVVNDEAQTQMDHATEETNTSIKDLQLPFNSSKIKLIPAKINQLDNCISCNIPMDDSYIAVINKGNAVNMNLQIELQNSETNNPSRKSIYTDMHKTCSITDLFKEKSVNCSVEEAVLQTKSLQAIVSSINDTFAKVVIVQCGCCGNNISVPKVDTMPVYKDDNGFFILMPAPTLPENSRCSCIQNHDDICNKKTKAELFIRDLCRPTPDTVYPCVTRQVGMVMTFIDSTGSQTDKYLNNNCESCMKTKQIMCINEDKCTVENCGKNCDSFLPFAYKLENESSNDYSQDLSNNVVEKYTQTEWCRVLLEVKRHEDGHYSFHLPPLTVLRQCSR